MMQQSCTIQVCLDNGKNEDEIVQRYILSQLLAPFASAIFCNSAFIDNERADKKNFRNFLWRTIDKSRTGFTDLNSIIENNDIETLCKAYADKIFNSYIIFIQSQDYVSPKNPTTFSEWIEHGINGYYPQEVDFMNQLSLMFPEVRPKGFFEIRTIDCTPEVWQSVPVLFYSSLLYHKKIREKALELIIPYASQIEELMQESQNGLENQVIFDVSKKLMHMILDEKSSFDSTLTDQKTFTSFEKFNDLFTERRSTMSDYLISIVEKNNRSNITLSDLQKNDFIKN